MTLFKGLLLFDIAEPPIGNWKNQLGYRGMMEIWKVKDTTQFLCIEAYEDCEIHDPDECTCEEVWLGDDTTGNCDVLGVYDNFEEADKASKEFMQQNPNGWM